jgi:hypothetical protein
MAETKEIYVLTNKGKPIIAHTTWQGAAMEMANEEPDAQRGMAVETIWLKDDS